MTVKQLMELHEIVSECYLQKKERYTDYVLTYSESGEYAYIYKNDADNAEKNYNEFLKMEVTIK